MSSTMPLSLKSHRISDRDSSIKLSSHAQVDVDNTVSSTVEEEALEAGAVTKYEESTPTESTGLCKRFLRQELDEAKDVPLESAFCVIEVAAC